VVDLLEPLRESPERTAILLDVDGTLAPIVERPEDAYVPDETRKVLRGLVARYALVAAVSGRPSEDAARMIGIPQIPIAGTHGLELEEVPQEWRDRMHDLARDAGLPFEDKGVSISFHYRGADDESRAREELESVAARAASVGLRPRFGRKVLELLPPIEVHKGTAVRRLLERAGLGRALYAGDDTTDIDAFAALETLELGVKVAVSSPEAPPGLLALADVVVEGPAGLLELLRRL
jgi:trehalose 6-phosphate phosphatase